MGKSYNSLSELLGTLVIRRRTTELPCGNYKPSPQASDREGRSCVIDGGLDLSACDWVRLNCDDAGLYHADEVKCISLSDSQV